jgi:hypothetical protein
MGGIVSKGRQKGTASASIGAKATDHLIRINFIFFKAI